MAANFEQGMDKWTTHGIASMVILCAVGCGQWKENQMAEVEPNSIQQSASQVDESEISLIATECNDIAKIGSVTASSAGSLFINSSDVVNDARAVGTGKWSFAYLMREILELPNPGSSPSLLAVEAAKVDGWISRYTQVAPVNTFVPSNRNITKAALFNAWGSVTGTDGKTYRTFANAPFKLVALVNRLDIVKKGRTSVTAGEGRFVFGFTGSGRMTVIFEYDLPIGVASGRGVANIGEWALKWQNLKKFLADTDSVRAGVQPNQNVDAALIFRDKLGYLSALETITELYANRNAQNYAGGTQAAIAQVRTNEILQSPWELREFVRGRNLAGVTSLVLTTVKNNPDQSFRSGENGFSTWIASNVICSIATDKNSCKYNTANGRLPGSIVNGTVNVALLGVTAPVSFPWFQGSSVIKNRFVALNTCNGCHQAETNTSFVHVHERTGAPSTFLKTDLVRRLISFKNLVCLATATRAEINLTDGVSIEERIQSTFGVH